MKKSHLLFLLFAGAILLIVVSFVAGQIFEKTATTQRDIRVLTSRVSQLESINMKSEERWGWARRVGLHVPGLRHLLG